LWHSPWKERGKKSPDFLIFRKMNHFQNLPPTGTHRESNSEFFKIYGITIVLAFAAAAFLRVHLLDEYTVPTEEHSIELVEQSLEQVPMPIPGEVACFDGVKKVFARIFR